MQQELSAFLSPWTYLPYLIIGLLLMHHRVYIKIIIISSAMHHNLPTGI